MNKTIQVLSNRYHYSIVLLRGLVITDFKLRYQGSVLGYVWSLLRPLFLFIILYIVFDQFLRIGATVPHYPVYLLLGIVIWNYFTEVTNIGMASIVTRGDIIRKLNFPKYVIVLAGSFSALINLAINLIVISAFIIFAGVDLRLDALLLVPLLVELFVFSLGMAFLLSALFVRFRDLNYIWEVTLQAAFYATPILYPLSLVVERSDKFAQILMLNPVAQIIQDARYVLITDRTMSFNELFGSDWYRLIPIVAVFAVLAFSARYFHEQSPKFAEEV